MLRKSSKCEKGKRLHNGEFAVFKGEISEIRASSICFVSHFFKKVPKNALNCKFIIQYYHRDILICFSACLYYLEKQVFCCIRLAWSDSNVESSQLAITNNRDRERKTLYLTLGKRASDLRSHHN